eukprot:Trichotokara_eunicae@DN5164_c0_g1_i1.p1
MGRPAKRPDASGSEASYLSDVPLAHQSVFKKLRGYKFRQSLRLSSADLEKARNKSRSVLKDEASRIIEERVGIYNPDNDGKQTPWREYPIFTAMHATATCCRGCIAKFHRVSCSGRLSEFQIAQFADIVVTWISMQLKQFPVVARENSPDQGNNTITDFLKPRKDSNEDQ